MFKISETSFLKVQLVIVKSKQAKPLFRLQALIFP